MGSIRLPHIIRPNESGELLPDPTRNQICRTMKKSPIVLLALLLGISMIAQAQILQRGNFLIGSTLGFSSADSKVKQVLNSVEQTNSGPVSLQLNFSPNVGYFLADDLVLGIGMDYTFGRFKEPNTDRTEDSNLLFGPFFRYYYDLGENMAFFGEMDLGFGNSSDDQFIGSTRQSITTNIFSVGVGPGFTIYSDNAIGIEALFKYNFARSHFNTIGVDQVQNETITKTNQFDISLGIQFYFSSIQPAGK